MSRHFSKEDIQVGQQACEKCSTSLFRRESRPKPQSTRYHSTSIQSCPTLCGPGNCSLPVSSMHGILQARILEWVAISSTRRPSQPRSPASQADSYCLSHRDSPHIHQDGLIKRADMGSLRRQGCVEIGILKRGWQKYKIVWPFGRQPGEASKFKEFPYDLSFLLFRISPREIKTDEELVCKYSQHGCSKQPKGRNSPNSPSSDEWISKVW